MDREGVGRYECAVWLEHISKQVDVSPSISRTENQDPEPWKVNFRGNATSYSIHLISELEVMRTAYQRFLPALGGPIALLPLPNNHATLVWSTTPENAAHLKFLPTPAFLAMVNAAFHMRAK
jgi:2-polyprenyl-6-methoxyphenol hydroxylase-like FAD-dependent oxidoreductase